MFVLIFLFGIVKEPHGVENTLKGGFRGTVVYIVPDEFAEAITRLKILRAIEGFNVETVRLSQIGSSSPESIKDYINNHIDDWDRPVFITLVGDIDYIPGKVWGGRHI